MLADARKQREISKGKISCFRLSSLNTFISDLYSYHFLNVKVMLCWYLILRVHMYTVLSFLSGTTQILITMSYFEKKFINRMRILNNSTENLSKHSKSLKHLFPHIQVPSLSQYKTDNYIHLIFKVNNTKMSTLPTLCGKTRLDLPSVSSYFLLQYYRSASKAFWLRRREKT